MNPFFEFEFLLFELAQHKLAGSRTFGHLLDFRIKFSMFSLHPNQYLVDQNASPFMTTRMVKSAREHTKQEIIVKSFFTQNLNRWLFTSRLTLHSPNGQRLYSVRAESELT